MHHLKLQFLAILSTFAWGQNLVLSDDPISAPKASAFGGLLLQPGDDIAAMFYQPAMLGGAGPHQQWIRNVRFPYLSQQTNPNGKTLNKESLAAGRATTTEYKAARDRLLGHDQSEYARHSAAFLVGVSRLALMPFYDQQISAIDRGSDVEIAHLTRTGGAIGLALREPSDALHLGISTSFQQIDYVAGMVEDDPTSHQYSGLDTNVGILAKLGKSVLRPTVSLAVRHAGNTRYKKTDDAASFLEERQDVILSLGASPLAGKDLSFDVAFGASRLDRPDVPVQNKARAGFEIGIFGRGRDALATIECGAQKQGMSFGGEINIGILSAQASHTPIQLDDDTQEYRTAISLSVDLARP